MDKKLPKLFQNEINQNINNNKNIFYSRNVEDDYENDTINIRQKINDIFSSINYVYSAKVDIFFDSSVKTTKIIGRNKDYLITIDNERIYISDIKDIKLNKD